MYDENAQDEATITVIATGLDSHGVNTPVAKAMTEFKTPFKAKTTGNTYAQPAAQTAAAAQPTYKAPTICSSTGTASCSEGSTAVGTGTAVPPDASGNTDQYSGFSEK